MKKEFEEHQHCEICGEYRKVNNDYIKAYVCDTCKKTFPKFYLIYRKINIHNRFKHNYDKENLLELRLTFGDKTLKNKQVKEK